MTKSSKTATAGAAAGAEDRDALFTAHQVHTLAQLTYQRFALSTNRWAGADGASTNVQSAGGPANWPGAAGQAMGGHPLPPTCFYWYV